MSEVSVEENSIKMLRRHFGEALRYLELIQEHTGRDDLAFDLEEAINGLSEFISTLHQEINRCYSELDTEIIDSDDFTELPKVWGSWSPNISGSSGSLTIVHKNIQLRVDDITIRDYLDFINNLQEDFGDARTLLKRMNISCS